MATASDVLNAARAELGYSRWNDPAQGTRYGRWYAQKTGVSYFGTSGVPYCAMFVSWVFSQAGATCAGLPSAYCPSILNAARNAGAIINSRSAQPGDVVLFDWNGGLVDHVGIVELNKGGYLQTIEGNTNNGRVARRTRAWGVVAAIVRPAYGGVATTQTAAKQPSGRLDVDGWWGPATTRRLEQVMGTYVDGVISDQWSGNRRYLKAATGGWEWHSNTHGGSTVMKATQRKLGVTADGLIGPDTIRALERRYGYNQDGVLDGPSPTVKALQTSLNAGRF